MTTTEREIEEIEAEETTQFSDKRDMETRYDYYQRQLDYFRRLSGYLTDRKKAIEQVRALFFSHAVVCAVLHSEEAVQGAERRRQSTVYERRHPLSLRTRLLCSQRWRYA